MTRDEFLNFLRTTVRATIERSADKIVATLSKDQDKLEAFRLDRLHLDELIAKLEHEQLEDIDKRLDEVSDQIQKGAQAMKDSLAKITTFSKGAELFSTVVGLAARVVALA